MSNPKTTGPRVIVQDGLSSEMLKKGLSSGNLQTALNNPPAPPPPQNPSPTQGDGSQGTSQGSPKK